jgi:hypothetical protein
MDPNYDDENDDDIPSGRRSRTPKPQPPRSRSHLTLNNGNAIVKGDEVEIVVTAKVAAIYVDKKYASVEYRAVLPGYQEPKHIRVPVDMIIRRTSTGIENGDDVRFYADGKSIGKVVYFDDAQIVIKREDDGSLCALTRVAVQRSPEGHLHTETKPFCFSAYIMTQAK